MALSKPIQSVTSAYLSNTADSGSNMLRACTTLSENVSFEPLKSAFYGESRYLTHLILFGFKLRANVGPHNQNIQDRIIAAMKLLSFRKQHVIVQFWSLRVVGKHRSLTNIGQPYGVGVIDERLLLYRKNSKLNVHVVDDESGEEDIDPIARVFTRELPEWTSDVTHYLPKYFPQQASAICCGLHGYLALPVFDSSTCVGVIEILTSLEYLEFSYEVQQVYNALKDFGQCCQNFKRITTTMPWVEHYGYSGCQDFIDSIHFSLKLSQKQNLTCTRVFDGPAANIPNERDKVWAILKSVCDEHDIPLAQTWAVSPFTTFVSHDAAIKKSCSSFDTKCIGNTCMSTVRLPFYVRDVNLLPFRKACREQHLDSSRGLVGKALSHGSCFCENVTKLGKEEYPLVQYAHMSGLTSCLAILLHSFETQADYVLEFFLPSEIADVSFVVQTLKQKIGLDSGFLLSDTSPMDFSDISDSESTVIDGSNRGSSANESMGKILAVTFADDEEASSPLKKLKIYSDPVPSVTLKVTYEKCEKSFIFPGSPGLLELVNKVAETFKLEGVMLRLKYWDKDNDLILVACDSDLAYLLTSGCNSISLICVANRLC